MPENASIKYRRLGGAGRYPTVSRGVMVLLFFVIGIFVLLLYRRRELYLGPDHLLTVDNHGYNEEYRFFNFADIQSITIRGTAHYTSGIVLLTLACAGLLSLGAVVGDTPGWAVFGTLTGILGIALLVHVIKGPTVECKLQTAVSEIELPSLARLNRARSCVAEIQAQVEKVQGRLDTENIPSQFDRLRAYVPSAAPVPQEPPETPPLSGDLADEKDSGTSF